MCLPWRSWQRSEEWWLLGDFILRDSHVSGAVVRQYLDLCYTTVLYYIAELYL